MNAVFENAIRAALVSRRQQRFWLAGFKRVQRPVLQVCTRAHSFVNAHTETERDRLSGRLRRNASSICNGLVCFRYGYTGAVLPTQAVLSRSVRLGQLFQRESTVPLQPTGMSMRTDILLTLSLENLYPINLLPIPMCSAKRK